MEENKQPEQTNSINSKITLLIGVLLVVLNIVVWVLLAKKPDYSTSVYVSGLALFILVLIAWFLRNQFNKEFYLGITALVIMLSIIASSNYLSNYRYQNERRQNVISEIQANINSFSSDQLISNSEKASTIKELKSTEASELSSPNKKSSVLPLLTSFVLAAAAIFYVVKLLQKTEVNESQPLDAEDYDQEETVSY